MTYLALDNKVVKRSEEGEEWGDEGKQGKRRKLDMDKVNKEGKVREGVKREEKNLVWKCDCGRRGRGEKMREGFKKKNGEEEGRRSGAGPC